MHAEIAYEERIVAYALVDNGTLHSAYALPAIFAAQPRFFFIGLGYPLAAETSMLNSTLIRAFAQATSTSPTSAACRFDATCECAARRQLARSFVDPHSMSPATRD